MSDISFPIDLGFWLIFLRLKSIIIAFNPTSTKRIVKNVITYVFAPVK